MTDSKKHGPETVATHAGLKPWDNHGIVNPPVYHASTILYPTVADLKSIASRRFEKGVYTYGRMGTPTSVALEEAVAALEGGYDAVVTSSGLSAVATALSACLSAGDHLLMVDSVYGPSRIYCDRVLSRFGVEVTYYDPLIGGGIAGLLRENTRLIYLESPGSHTFEVQDVPAITAVAKARGITTMIDNTWGTPLYLKPFDLGVDVSVHAATKYIVGHSDVMMGMIVCADQATYLKVKTHAYETGQCAGPDDMYLALRGLRTMPVRLKQHFHNGLTIARWLQDRPEVARVLHPGLEDDPGHALWKRDFSGACGLFGVVLAPCPPEAVAAMLDHMDLFRMGYSWGGYESLAVPSDPRAIRTATEWTQPGPMIRLHIGLEDPDDLIDDLSRGFDRLTAAAGTA